MSRHVVALDRLAALLVGLALVAAGLLAFAWSTNLVLDLPAKIDTTAVTDVLETAWWPWALAGAGVILVVAGTWWFVGHFTSQAVGRLALPGSDSGGRLVADTRPVAKAVGAAFGETRGVRSSRAAITHDRGQLIARIDATIEHDADLEAVARSADKVSGELRQVLGRDDIKCQVQLKVSARNSGLARVV